MMRTRNSPPRCYEGHNRPIKMSNNAVPISENAEDWTKTALSSPLLLINALYLIQSRLPAMSPVLLLQPTIEALHPDELHLSREFLVEPPRSCAGNFASIAPTEFS